MPAGGEEAFYSEKTGEGRTGLIEDERKDFLNYEEFICRVQAEVKEKMGEKAQVERRRITKNNGVELEGITITEEGQRISPMIYLDEYYSIYERGVTIPQIGEDILRIYERSRESLPKTPDFYTDFEKVKARLACKLINYQRNEKQLVRVPYVRCLDLRWYFIMRWRRKRSAGERS